jgi:cytochrome c
VPDNFTLSDRTMAQAQQLLPNRNGVTVDHGLWPGKGLGNGGKPDTKAVACMKDCAPEPALASFLPDFARNAHGNLAEQNRAVGAQHGADTSRPAPANTTEARTVAAAAPALAALPASPGAKAALALMQKHACVVCHGVDSKIVGPAFRDVAKKYGERPDAVAYLMGKIRSGGMGLWGAIPMPPQTLNDADARTIAQWLAAGAAK